MSIHFNRVTWYSKWGTVIVFLVVVPVIAFYFGMRYQQIIDMRSSGDVGSGVSHMESTSTFSDPLDGTYEIDGQKVTLNRGVSEIPIEGSSASFTVSSFGQPTVGDLDGDGYDDAIFIVSEETGGTGIFYFVVAAVNVSASVSGSSSHTTFIGTKAIYLGDRIAPQNIGIEDGIALVNYATRRDNDPMTTQPSIGVTKRLKIQEGELMEVAK